MSLPPKNLFLGLCSFHFVQCTYTSIRHQDLFIKILVTPICHHIIFNSSFPFIRITVTFKIRITKSSPRASRNSVKIFDIISHIQCENTFSQEFFKIPFSL